MDLQASVIIPTFEDWNGLQICLDCLARQTADPAVFEVIVANNNASPDLPPSLRLAPNARVIHVPKPGSYAARNAAILDARADILFFTDSDCLPDSRWIEAGLAAISPLPELDMVAGAIELFSPGERWSATELYNRIHYLQQADYAAEGWCATANLLVRRVAFDRYGPFNESRFSGADKEWTENATNLGSRLHYRDEVVIRHPVRTDFKALAKMRRRHIGGAHHAEQQGLRPRRPLLSYMGFVSRSRLVKTLNYPDLTEAQRFKVMCVDILLSMIAFTEVVRLRYLRGKPSRA
jgi:glycosyltransferase involved in cell wall biosynthesis